jgi:hypothetical protein
MNDPADNHMGSKLWGVLTVANLLVGILIAVFTAFIDNRQKVLASHQDELKQALESRIQMEGITQIYTDKIFAHLADLKLEGSDHAGMVIDLFDMITEANIGGRAYSDAKREQLIPLRMALLTGNDDELSNIGFDQNKRALWVKFARESRNDKVRGTALRALGKIGTYARRESQLDELRFCIANILDISESFQRSAIYDDARHSIEGLVTVIEKEPILLDDNDLKNLFVRVTQQLASVRSDLLQKAPPPVESPSPAASKASRRSNHGSPTSLYLAVTDLEPRSEPFLIVGEPTRQLRETDEILNKLGKLNLSEQRDRTAATPAPLDEVKTKELLKKLYSGKTEDRKEARISLVSRGAESLKPLLKMLQVENLDPSLRISLSYTLDQLQQPVIVTDDEDIRALTNLIGDDQREVRRYVSSFLMKFSDGASVRRVSESLLAIPHADPAKTGDALYDAVVVIGTWIRVLPPELNDLKKKLSTDLINLNAELADPQWKRVRGLIDEIITLNRVGQ